MGHQIPKERAAQSASGVGRSNVPSLPSQRARRVEEACLGCICVLEEDLGHWGFATAAHPEVQGKDNGEGKRRKGSHISG